MSPKLACRDKNWQHFALSPTCCRHVSQPSWFGGGQSWLFSLRVNRWWMMNMLKKKNITQTTHVSLHMITSYNKSRRGGPRAKGCISQLKRMPWLCNWVLNVCVMWGWSRLCKRWTKFCTMAIPIINVMQSTGAKCKQWSCRQLKRKGKTICSWWYGQPRGRREFRWKWWRWQRDATSWKHLSK